MNDADADALAGSDWRAYAACRDMDVRFFVYEAGELTTERKATLQSICEPCPSTAQCRLYAVQVDAMGWWGGMSQRQRDKWAREQGLRGRDAT